MRASTYPLIDADAAAALVLERTVVLGVERVALAEAPGRVLAEDLVARAPLPPFPSSAVDGYAVHASDAGRSLRVGDVSRRAGTRLGAAELGIAAASAHARLPVHRRPRVALMSTGDELVEVGKAPGRGQIPDSNRWALLAALREAGADVDVLGIAPDEAAALRGFVTGALARADALVTSGGVS